LSPNGAQNVPDQAGRRSRPAPPFGRLDEKRPYTAEKPASPHHSNAQSDRLLETAQEMQRRGQLAPTDLWMIDDLAKRIAALAK